MEHNSLTSSDQGFLLAHILPFDASQDSVGYTYSVPVEFAPAIAIGQLVQMPFRNDLAE